ncbi:MAG: serine hydrolase [Planctomycetota bacterium]
MNLRPTVLALASWAGLVASTYVADLETSWAQTCDFSPVLAIAEAIVDDAALVDAAGVWLETGDSSVAVESYVGPYGPSTVIPIASASKLISAVALLTLVDDGLLDLDLPLSNYLPEFTGLKGTMTVRQMFSHTSGLPGGSTHPVLSDSSITLAEAASQIACCIELDAPPGTQFAYGGLSMHVVGRVAEVVTGQPWAVLFATRVAVPLGLTDTDYYAFGFTQNPRVAGGVRSTLTDYAVVLRMLRDGGLHQGVPFLSANALSVLTSDQTNGVPIVDSPAGDDRRYGFGAWLDLVGDDGETLRISSPGAFGFTPWVDLDLHLSGLFVIEYLFSLVQTEVEAMQALARSEVLDCVAQFRRGDVNRDQALDIADVVSLLGVLFSAPPPLPEPGCVDRLDTNDDGAVDIADAVRLLATLFGASAPPLPAPGASCNFDGTPDALPCEASACP